MARVHGNKLMVAVYLDPADYKLLEERAQKTGNGMATEARTILRFVLRSADVEVEERERVA